MVDPAGRDGTAYAKAEYGLPVLFDKRDPGFQNIESTSGIIVHLAAIAGPLAPMLLMELTFGIPDWPSGVRVSAEELVERLHRRFPAMVVDRAKGNAFLQQQLDMLIAMRVPEAIVQSHQGCFGQTIHVSISDSQWLGGMASSYVSSIVNPALQGVDFEITGVADETTKNRIARELADALDMALCEEINWESGGLLKGKRAVRGQAKNEA